MGCIVCYDSTERYFFFFLSLIEYIGFYHNALDDALYQFEVRVFIIISRFQIEIEI